MTFASEKIRAFSVGDRVNLVSSKTRGDVTHHVETSFPKGDAPAVALSILQAAGWEDGAPGRDEYDPANIILQELKDLVRDLAGEKSRAEEREAEDAKVVEFHTAIGANLNRIERHHRDLYNAARKFFEGS